MCHSVKIKLTNLIGELDLSKSHGYQVRKLSIAGRVLQKVCDQFFKLSQRETKNLHKKKPKKTHIFKKFHSFKIDPVNKN